MEKLCPKLQAVDWNRAAIEINEQGYSIVGNMLDDELCQQAIALYERPEKFRKKVVMERYRFGLGEYKYFDYPLPKLVQHLREEIYPKLVPLANRWMQLLRIENRYPLTHSEFQMQCHANQQSKPTPLLLKYGKGGFNTLHQDRYGDLFFPLQTVLFLNEPDVDYTGGEFVMTEQMPRAQSKAIVLRPKKGDMLIFTTNFRPVKGKKGYYRVNMKHGVSTVRKGERHTMGIIFHDAPN